MRCYKESLHITAKVNDVQQKRTLFLPKQLNLPYIVICLNQDWLDLQKAAQGNMDVILLEISHFLHHLPSVCFGG